VINALVVVAMTDAQDTAPIEACPGAWNGGVATPTLT
jgi:hypothetical protein